MIRKIITWCFSQCILCGSRGQDNISLCSDCIHDLPWLKSSCYRCGQPTEIPVKQCGICLKESPPFLRTFALFHYDDLLAKCIHALKFQHRLAFGKLFGTLMARQLEGVYRHDTLPECIVPMPLHASRLKERGFNQALELTYPIAKHLELPIEKHQCQRIKATLAQAQTPSSDARKKNVKKAFTVLAPLPYTHVAIVDDVVTTGATVSALSEALLTSGVKRVDVWSCARTCKSAFL